MVDSGKNKLPELLGEPLMDNEKILAFAIGEIAFDEAKEDIIRAAHAGKNLENCYPVLRMALRSPRNFYDIIGLVKVIDDDELTRDMVYRCCNMLQMNLEPQGGAMKFLLWAKERGIGEVIVDDLIRSIGESIINNFWENRPNPAIRKLQLLWDNDLELPSDIVLHLENLVALKFFHTKSRQFEIAFEILFDHYSKEGEWGKVKDFLNQIGYGRMEAICKKITLELIEPFEKEIVEYMAIRVEHQNIRPEPGLVLLERMAARGKDVSGALDALLKEQYSDGEFDKKYPNLSWWCKCQGRGLINNEEFDRSFKGVTAMMEKRPMGPDGRPIKRMRMVSGSI